MPGNLRGKGSPPVILLLDVAQSMQPETQNMQPVIVHDSRNTTYRYPFGAVEAGSVVTLRCDVEGDGTEQVTLRLWQEGAGETLYAMQAETWKRKQETEKAEKLPDENIAAAESVTEPSLQEETKTTKDSGSLNGKVLRKKCRYTCRISVPKTGCLLWYYFIVKTADKTFYYGNNASRLGGWGQQYGQEPPSYQITVYDRGAVTPDWMKQAVVYQIFPDRFNRGDVPLSHCAAMWKGTEQNR